MDAGRIDPAYWRDRRRLIEGLQAGGVNDLAILHAFDAIPRHMFVPDAVRHRSYDDVALPLGHGQTISRPGAHALHLGLAGLTGEEKVLEIGTGSGYQTALLSQLAAQEIADLKSRGIEPTLDECIWLNDLARKVEAPEGKYFFTP